MENTESNISLPEEDYLTILDAINRFNQCATRSELKMGLEKILHPLLKAQSSIICWYFPEVSTGHLIDTVGISETSTKLLSEYIPYDPTGKRCLEHFRPVIVHDVDVPQKTVDKELENFFTDRTDCFEDYDFLSTLKNWAVAVDLPDFSLGMGIHRHKPHAKPWTLRDARILQLLQPHLFHTIKTIVTTEELVKFQSISNALANVSTAIAAVSPDMRIIFGNEAFQLLIPCKPGGRLPKEMSELIMREIDRYEAPYHADDSIIEIPFFRMDKETYRLSITLLKGRGLGEDRCYLLRMQAAVEPYSRLRLLMEEAKLTHREMEICYLIRDGFDNQEIADRLFISLGTVKNHLKSIHKKFGVPSRAKLVALLNQ